MKRNEKKRQLRGFTLVELVVVLVILGVLVTLAVPRFTTIATKAKPTTFCSNVRTIKSQLELYKMTTGAYPVTASLGVFLNDPKYFESAPVNPYTSSAFQYNGGTITNSTAAGYFTYTSTDGSAYTITASPDCSNIK